MSAANNFNANANLANAAAAGAVAGAVKQPELNNPNTANANPANALNINLNAAAALTAASRVPMASPIADFSFVTDMALPPSISAAYGGFDLADPSLGLAAASAMDVSAAATASAFNALRATAATRNAAGAGGGAVLPSPSPPLNLPFGLGFGASGDATMPPALTALPAAAHGSLLTRDPATKPSASAVASGAAAAHPFSFAGTAAALALSAPGSPSLSLAGDDDPDSPSSIASDLSSASSLLTSAAVSPRVLSSLPRHSSTPSLSALAAYPSPSAPSPATLVRPSGLPSLKPALRTSNSKGNLSGLVAASPASAAAAKSVSHSSALTSFSLSGTGSAVQVPNSTSRAAAAAKDDAVEQPSKKKQKANDASMRRVKSSPAVAARDDSDDDDAADEDDDDDAADAKGAGANSKLKDLNKPISLFTKDGKPKSEAEIKREKAERRLAKKAEAARQSRKRKKAYVQQLEDKAAKLEARLAALEAQQTNAANAAAATPQPAIASPALNPLAAAIGSPASAAAANATANGPASASAMAQATSLHALHRAEQSEVLREMAKAVSAFVALASGPNASSAASEKERARVLEDVKALIERYVVNSRKRQSTVTYYLDRMTELLSPEPAVKVALWGLTQADSFYALANPSNPNATPNVNAAAAAAGNVFGAMMAADVGLSGAQLTKLVTEFRAPVSGVMAALRTSAGHLAELREYVKSHIVARNRHIDELRHILNPIQVANYLLWLDRNPQLAAKLAATHATGTPIVTATAVAGPIAAVASSHGK